METNAIEMVVTLVLVTIAYLTTFRLAVRYGEDWTTPEGTEDENWELRHVMGLCLGLAAVLANAIFATIFVQDIFLRLMICAQSVLLATAGASDIRIFHLPLPLTLLGYIVAILSIAIFKVPLFIVLFGVIWAAALIGLHAVLSKGSMQLGDHITTLWIALAMPFNGMLAVILGDFANVAVARAKSLQGKKVAAAGAWLIFAAAFTAFPSYYVLVQSLTAH